MQMYQWLELIAIAFGILSVWFSKKENILVYPTGLINTIIYVYLSFDADLFGEALANFYYTIMSIYGWYNWARKDQFQKRVVNITFSNRQQWVQQLLFFLIMYAVLYGSLVSVKEAFAPGAIPWADALATASAFTAMWLMTQKKVEGWIWWIITNIVSIPLYYVKDLKFTSGYYFILLVLAVAGWIEWSSRAKKRVA